MDTTEKRLVISLHGKDDGATGTLDRVGSRVDSLEHKLKKFGKISGIGGFKQASDVAEGFEGGLGTLGKIAGTAAAIEGVGRAMKAIGDGLSSAVDSGESFVDTLDKIVTKLPVIGTMKQGAESLAEGFAKAAAAATGLIDVETAGRRGKITAQLAGGNVIAGVRNAVNEVTGVNAAQSESSKLDENTKKIRQTIDANSKDEAIGNDVIRKGMSERARIEADRDDQLEKIMDRRRAWMARNAGISKDQEERFAAEEAAVKRQAGDKIAKAAYDANEAIVRVEQERINAMREMRNDQRKASEEAMDDLAETMRIQANTQISNLRDSGDKTGAELAKIAQDYKEKIDAIDKEIRRINADDSLTPGEKADKTRGLETRKDALGNEADTQTRIAQSNAEKDSAEKVLEINRKIFELQADGGNEAAKREMEKLAIVQEGLEVQKQINELLKDTSLTADQRSALQGQLAMLPGIADKRMAAIDQEAAKAAIGSQQADRTRLFDARGQTGFFNQSKQVNTLEDSSKKTSDNTKTLVEKFDRLITIIDQKLGTQTPAFAYL